MNGGEESRGASVFGAWPAVSLALLEDLGWGVKQGTLHPCCRLRNGVAGDKGANICLGWSPAFWASIFPIMLSLMAMGLQGSHASNGAFLMAQTVKNSPGMQETQIQSLGWKYPLEKGMATHPCILAWRIPRTEEPGSL